MRVSGKDVCYLAGQAFRAVSELNQALVALNRRRLLNEKKAVWRAEGLALRPAEYRQRMEQAFRSVADASARAVQMLRKLVRETALLREGE